MVHFTLNGREVAVEGGRSLLSFLRDEARLTGAKNGCGEGSCGACSVIVDGALRSSCTMPIERAEGAAVVTVEGVPGPEMDCYVRAFSEAGAVQCGYCTPGMVMAAKALLDSQPDPDESAVRAGLRRNLCRCTGYVKIVDAVLRAGRYRRGGAPDRASPVGRGGVGSRLARVEAPEKIRGRAAYVDDFAEPGMLFGGALRSPHPRARLRALDVSEALALPGVVVAATWRDIPGSRFTGHVRSDWPTLVAVGEETRYVGDAVALVAAESPAVLQKALGLIRAEYDVLDPVRTPEAAMAPDAPAIHPGGNVLSRLHLERGNARSVLAHAAHVVEASFTTSFTDHAFLEPESALGYPPDADGVVMVRTGEQNVYDGQRYVADTLGIPREKIRIVSAWVGGGFGGKEDQTVQHLAALLAWLSRRPVKCTLFRAESSRVHVKRHPMSINLRVGCDAQGRLVGLEGRIVADTGAYASLGGPVLHRAVTHAGGPYAYENIDVEGIAVHTNNPPAGAFRGFGVPQVAFALESALDQLAARAGISPWEIRFRNAVRPGDRLPNGQVAGPDTALEECLLAVRATYEASRGRAGIACGFKNTGLGMGHPDVGRCILRIGRDHVELLSAAACIGQGVATMLTQIACQVLGLDPAQVVVREPDTAAAPDSGTTTASRQTLITGEACRRACAAAVDAARAAADGARPSAGALLRALDGREFLGEFEAVTDSFESDRADPVRHIAYSYACHLVFLGPDHRIERVVAAHDSGLVVNPLSFEGQVEGGVVMGLGFALTETFPLSDCVPTARFGQLGLWRAADVPRIETIIVRKAGAGPALDGGVSGAGYGAKGIGEISAIPTAPAVAGAYFALDGRLRSRLPLEETPYRRDVP
ncbi:MAG TPA: selenium-dependent xanthine dehydrogenase [Spirochaetia bacterium]|nr:selenium-dependent xanthine dehydrogenase [Spirochaetia bacterium]